MSNIICHYGIKGMRWGHRNPQMQGPTQPLNVKIKKAATTNNISAVKGMSDYSRSGIEAIRNTSANVHRSNKGGNARVEARRMTEAQLKEKIQRMNLEQQYANLNSQNVSKGRVNLENTLAVTGGLLATTSSVLGIALMVKQLSGN